jgi:hypothetical protein
MRKQVFAFWRDVFIAAAMLTFMVVIGVLASSCVIKKNGKPFVTLDGETFNPVVEHSEIKCNSKQIISLTADSSLERCPIFPRDINTTKYIKSHERCPDCSTALVVDGSQTKASKK